MSILVVVVEFFKPSAYYFSFFLIDKKNYGDRLEAVFRSSAIQRIVSFLDIYI